MTIQQTLSLLNSLTSKHSNTLYDETSFHPHFLKQKIGVSIEALGVNFEDVENSLNKLIHGIQADRDKFIYNDYDNLNKAKIEINDIMLYGLKTSFRRNLDRSINHLNTFTKMPHIYNLDDHEARINQIEAIKKLSENLMDKFEFDQKFDNKVRMINRQLEYSFQQPKEKAFLVSKIKKLIDEYPILDENNIRSLFDTFKLECIQLADSCKNLVILSNPTEFHCMADRFISAIDTGDTPIQQFLINKQNNIEIASEIKLTKSQKNQEAYIFSDDSIVVKNRNDEYRKISGASELRKLNVELHADSIDFMLRKKPQISKFFKSKFLEERAFTTAINAVVSFTENEAVLKNKRVDLTHFKDKSFEGIDDYINDIKKRHQVEQFAGSILSAKYKHLLNDNTFNYFETLHEQDFSQKELQMYIGKKLAAIKTEDDMIEVLQATINIFSGFSAEKVSEKLKKMNIYPILNENNRLIFEVTSYDECKQLGSPSWCIVRDESYFDQYTDGESRQYICYDFNKDQSSYESMLGFTYESDGSMNTAHYKNDDYLELSLHPELEKAFEKTLYLNSDNHNLSKERLSELDIHYGIKKKNQNGMKLS